MIITCHHTDGRPPDVFDLPVTEAELLELRAGFRAYCGQRCTSLDAYVWVKRFRAEIHDRGKVYYRAELAAAIARERVECSGAVAVADGVAELGEGAGT